jgi:hypothetical protein
LADEMRVEIKYMASFNVVAGYQTDVTNEGQNVNSVLNRPNFSQVKCRAGGLHSVFKLADGGLPPTGGIYKC